MATPLTYPPLIPFPFAYTGAKNTIPEAPASPLASLEDGFPPVTMQPISTGGVPPAGKDFNGIFNWITEFQAWVNGGGKFKFDATFATAIGGYPVGVVIQLNDNVSEVVCVTANNTNDPNTVMTGWAPYGGAAAGIGNYVADTGSVNNVVATVSPGISSYKNGYWVVFKALNTNTGAVTLNTGGGAVPLKRSDGAALVAGDIKSGSIYRAIYDTLSVTFKLETEVPSQVSATLFSTQYDKTGTRALATDYTNNTGRPVYVSVNGTVTAAGVGVQFKVDGLKLSDVATSTNGSQLSAWGMVPPNSVYRVDAGGPGTLVIAKWIEIY